MSASARGVIGVNGQDMGPSRGLGPGVWGGLVMSLFAMNKKNPFPSEEEGREGGREEQRGKEGLGESNQTRNGRGEIRQYSHRMKTSYCLNASTSCNSKVPPLILFSQTHTQYLLKSCSITNIP